MLAITTKYHGPTNTRGSRITASADVADPKTGRDPMRVSVGYDHAAASPMEAHKAAADELMTRLARTSSDPSPFALLGGNTPDGYVFLVVRPWSGDELRSALAQADAAGFEMVRSGKA